MNECDGFCAAFWAPSAVFQTNIEEEEKYFLTQFYHAFFIEWGWNCISFLHPSLAHKILYTQMNRNILEQE